MARRVTVVLARLLVPILAASLLLRPGLAAAQGALPRYEVAGFRDARFGMTEPVVRTRLPPGHVLLSVISSRPYTHVAQPRGPARGL